MKALLVSHPSSLEHDTGPRHPERAARLPAVIEGIRSSGLEIIDHAPLPIDPELLTTVHTEEYVAEIEEFCRAGGGALDPDTYAVPASWPAALRAARGGLDAIDLLESGSAEVGFVAMRPPGHHALPSRAMGFCLFNNIAVAARSLANRGRRVAIVDWDVHHGNGTQEVFLRDPDVLYVSWHQYPFYPGTGAIEPDPSANQKTTINFPFPAGTDGGAYHWTMGEAVGPAIRAFAADWVLVSCGYDAHRADPLAQLSLEASDFRRLARAIATTVPSQRLIFFLEGGYDLAALSESARATLQGVAEAGTDDVAEAGADDDIGTEGSGPTWDVARVVVARVKRLWEPG